MQILSRVFSGGNLYRTKIQLPFGWRLHKFHRGDNDRAWHDHPNAFWTLPFSDYVEQRYDPATKTYKTIVVKAWQWHFRAATYAHRLMGRADGRDKPHWTLVRELPYEREWGFYVPSDGRWIWWRTFLFGETR